MLTGPGGRGATRFKHAQVPAPKASILVIGVSDARGSTGVILVEEWKEGVTRGVKWDGAMVWRWGIDMSE